jgi:broad specificity phosphatase PhoE
VSFHEHEHPRAAAGTFTDKVQGAPEVSLGSAEAETEMLTIGRSRKTMRDIADRKAAAAAAVKALEEEERVLAAAHLKVLAKHYAPDTARIILSSYGSGWARVVRLEAEDGTPVGLDIGDTGLTRLNETSAILRDWHTLSAYATRHGEHRNHEYAMEVR